ncbi:cellulose synthase subunit BcsC-related outer membrane protein [Pseudomonas sp. LJDD11]|uniref:cellulose synthase subunit BcsC-related outer membrane protein n=1 Tax=unclassified Pseudomonas TaxID=196821 RepID=UPI0005EF0802|nr:MULTISPECIES: cellulose synthase subunit BcsC-related outer membrane protein [unclassified Pseudomonas]MCQ9425594.1 cellulose synthase subunit BcsC-related outer membrane protein [Pseudomonas sp. LJDD11]
MRTPRTVMLSGVLATLFNAGVYAAPLTPAGQALLEQGRYWQNQNDPQRATEVWKKLLLIDPQQIDAQYGLGLLELKAKRTAAATRYLEQMRSAHPGDPLTLQLEQAIALTSGDASQRLENARLAAQNGELDKAVGLYRQLFANKPPQGELALEFYSYLGYTRTGWNESRQGLERLLAQEPDNAKVKLVLAKLLIRNETTRVDGIRRLAQLSTVPELGGEATESWRQALVWLGAPRPAEVALFEAYLKANPDDSELREQMQGKGAAAAQVQQNPHLARGFKALQDNQLDVAEQAFQARLKEQAQDADALGGMGLVRQRQGRFNEANELLGRAVARSGNARWQTALDANRYWALLGQAGTARADKDLQRAANLLQQAIALKPRQIEGHVAQGSLQAEQGRFDDAQASYRQALALDAANPDALMGMLTVLTQSGQTAEAQRLIDGLSAAQQQRLGDLRPLRAALAAGQARNAELRGDLRSALAAQQDAVRNEPKNAWLRNDLARLYLLDNAPDKARQVIDDLLKNDSANPEALYVAALVAARMSDFPAAQRHLERIPAAQRTPAMQSLASDLRVQSLITQAGEQVRKGNRQAAVDLLSRAETSARDEQLSALANAWIEAGQPERALQLLRQAQERSPSPTPELRLAYAGALLKSGDDVQVNQILNELQNRNLTPAQRRSYDDLLFLYRVRQADLLRDQGNLVAAYDTLAPALEQRPNDPLAGAALARMYLANNDPHKAVALYQPLLAKYPRDASLQIGIAQAWNQLGESRKAEKAVDEAVDLAGNDPQILLTAAGLLRAQGKTSRAAELYSRALALQEPLHQPGVNPFAKATASNPFVGQPGQRGQSRLAQQGNLNQIPEPAEVQAAAVEPVAPVAVPVPQFAAAQAPARYATPDSYAAGYAAGYAAVAQASAPPPREPATVRKAAPVPVDPWQQARQSLEQIRQERSPSVTQGVSYRSNNSESGLGKMSEVQAPLEIRMPLGDDRLALRVTPVSLNAGSVDDTAAFRFGSGPTLSPLQNLSGLTAVQTAAAQEALGADVDLRGASAAGIGRQKDSGVGLAVAYESPSLGLKSDLGTSPIGFLYSTVVGGISLERPFVEGGDWRYSINLSRRPVTDSLASFAGVQDRRTGVEWGGVTANGGRVQLSYDNGHFGTYGVAAVHELVGHNVADNQRREGSAGAYWYIFNDDSKQFTVGVNLTAIGFDQNQNFYTYGHGGYFSPQGFYALSAPIGWSQRSGRLSYSLRGALGVQHIQQDGADFYPNDKALQASLEATAQNLAGAGLGVSTQYAGQSKTGVGYNLAAAAEYQMGDNFFLGGQFGLDNARDYRQWSGGLYLRYMFEDFSGPMALPVSPYRSPYSN